MTSVKELFEKMELNSDQIEKPSIVQQWLAKHQFVVSSFVCGASSQPPSEKVKVTTSCGLDYEVVCGTEQLLKDALSRADKAQQVWRETCPQGKTRAVYAVARNFQKHVTLFGTAEAVNFPFKRLERCRGACATYTIEYLYNAAARRNFDETSPRYSAMLVAQSPKFCPFNQVAEWRIGEALAANTPVVLAVSPAHCLPALVFAEICHTAGLPPNLFNVVILPESAFAAMEAPSDVMVLRLRERCRYVSTCIIAEGADIGSAVNGACEALSDSWGMPNYLGAVVYVQDCIRPKVLKILEAQVKTLKVASSNFAKTVDLVAEFNAKIVKDAHIHLETTPPTPTIYVQGFRTLKEVVSLASTGPLHSECLSVWTEYVARAVEIAERITGFRHIWINGQNKFDIDLVALSEFYFPSGKTDLSEKVHRTVPPVPDVGVEHVPNNIDSTLKLYYGGSKKRAESQSCYPVYNRFPPFDKGDKILAYVPAAGPKDVRNAVEASLKAFPGWRSKSAFNRSQVMYFFGENLSERRADLTERLSLNTGHSDCTQELQESIDATFKWAGLCDTNAPSFTCSSGMKVYSSYEPHGVIAIVCPPIKAMRSLITLMVSAISIGNTVVIVVPEEYPIAALKLAEVIEISDIPAGVINIISGVTDALLTTLAGHHDVHALWCWANRRSDQIVKACEASGKRSVWWFNISSKDPSRVWPDEELDFYRRDRKYVWLPCSSVFAN